jgi:isoaspartyl peptidase/L-asparaginase-like protein (Ntn-hydrolase superfamily)
MRVLLSKYACDQMGQGMPAFRAAQQTMKYVSSIFTDSMSGVILIDKDGNVGAAHTTPKMAVGWVDNAGNIHTAMNAGGFEPQRTQS